MATASSCRRRAWFRSPACCARCSSTYRRGARLKVPPIPPSAPRDNAATSRSSEPSSSEKLSGVAARSRARIARSLLVYFRPASVPSAARERSEEHTSELQSRFDLVCRLLLEKKNFGGG